MKNVNNYSENFKKPNGSTNCFFVSDLHGRIDRFQKLFQTIEIEKPEIVFLGGDILPKLQSSGNGIKDFINDYLLKELSYLRVKLKDSYPRIFVILGNDDGQYYEKSLIKASSEGLLDYIHNCKKQVGRWTIYGYSYVPPTPYRLKDWERYDVSRYIDPGCISPEEGEHSFPISPNEVRYSTIQKDLNELTGTEDLHDAVFLFHTPPYKSNLDRAALDGQMIDHVPLDLHVGSIAVRRLVEAKQPHLTLHGHIHESAKITGAWQDRIGRTIMISAAHDGPELALVKFYLEDPNSATRELL
ncbi:metallophosphoesterase [bacterium]|nr:metallophosphoesterase [bacterium]